MRRTCGSTWSVFPDLVVPTIGVLSPGVLVLRVLLLCVLLAPVSAGAQEAPDLGRPKTVRNAYLYMLATTAIPAVASAILVAEDDNSAAGQVLGVYAFMVGPAGGHLYAHDWGTAAATSALRLVGGLGYAYGLLTLIQIEPFDDGNENVAAAALIGGAAVALAATIWNVTSMRGSVARYNDARRFALSPAVGPGYGGLVATIRF